MSETINTFTVYLASMLALCPDMDVPTRLRETVDSLAKCIQREIVEALADPTFAADLFSMRKEGHA